MIDPSEILELALVDFGTDATVNGETLRVIPDLEGETVLSGDVIDHTGPYCTALKTAVDALETTLVTGNNGHIITILGRTFRILNLDPDEQGGVVFSLEET